jgi:hypothetical protein
MASLLSKSQSRFFAALTVGLLCLGVSAQTIEAALAANLTSLSRNLTVSTIVYPPTLLNISGQIFQPYDGPRLERTVAWFQAGNLAIVDGDVIFGTVADLENAIVSPGVKKRAHSILATDSIKWPGGVFTYKWESQELKNQKGANWDKAVKMWTDRVPSLTFIEASLPNSDHSDPGGPVLLVGGKDVCRGCSFSMIGRAPSKESNEISLGDCECPSAYAHEIGHSKFD